MADANLEERIAAAFKGMSPTTQRMFGGLCFMLNGNMVVGTFRDELLVRVGKEGGDAALAKPHARPMVHGGRSMAGYVLVDPEGLRRDRDLKSWIDLAVAHVSTLPAKPAKAAGAKPRKTRKGTKP